MINVHNPFHEGERDAQRRAEVGDVARWAGGFIRDHMPEQHREFFAALPFMVIAGADAQGRPWVSLLEGPEGFLATPEPTVLTARAGLAEQDPLAATLQPGAHLGMLGIDLATRRRNRMNGVLCAADAGVRIKVQQSFGNCPSHIRQRSWFRTSPDPAPEARHARRLSVAQRDWIARADTLFIGTGWAGGDKAARGFDASHRGGPAGFVQVTQTGDLQIPDYAGNSFFNTIGNLLRDPRVGLLFVDFDTGSLLQISGRAFVDWAPKDSHDPHALRMIRVKIETVIERPGALSLRWSQQETDLGALRLVRKEPETPDVMSFYFAAADGGALPAFAPGQYLPVALPVAGLPTSVERSYSLSGDPEATTYRISVKREPDGVGSRWLHDALRVGDRIAAQVPSGSFRLPEGEAPVVLASAGVGITPFLPMLHASARRHPARVVWNVHGTRNGASHGFGREIGDLAGAAPGIEHRVFFSAPDPYDVRGRDYDQSGRITAGYLHRLSPDPDTTYLLCGPPAFIADLRIGLEALGVGGESILFEAFGPSVSTK